MPRRATRAREGVKFVSDSISGCEERRRKSLQSPASFLLNIGIWNAALTAIIPMLRRASAKGNYMRYRRPAGYIALLTILPDSHGHGRPDDGEDYPPVYCLLLVCWSSRSRGLSPTSPHLN